MRPEAIIVLDPGHGGSDPGAIGPTRVQEKWVNLNIAYHTADWLDKNGISCVLTRKSDEYVSLQKRCDIANQADANCFISIHCNASKNRTAQGIEVYHYKDSVAGQTLASILNTTILTEASRPSAIVKAASETAIPATAEEAAELNNRGVKEAQFYVLRHTAMPAALVEVAFISNPTEEIWLADIANQKLVGKAIAKAICQYLGAPWINEWEEQRKAALQKLAVKAGFNTSHETTELVDMGLLAVVLERLGVI